MEKEKINSVICMNLLLTLNNAYTDDEDHENTHKFTKQEKFFQSCSSQGRNEKVHLKKAHIILLDSKNDLYIKYLQNHPVQVVSIADIKLKV